MNCRRNYIKIDWSQPSTWRGAIWLFFGVIGGIAYMAGKDISPLLSFAATIAGGAGVVISDKED